MSELHYAHGTGDCPEELAERGDAIRIWVSEHDFWRLRMRGIDLIETGDVDGTRTCIGKDPTEPS